MNVNSLVQNVTRIKSEITINASVSVTTLKNIMCAKKVIFETLVDVAVNNHT